MRCCWNSYHSKPRWKIKIKWNKQYHTTVAGVWSFAGAFWVSPEMKQIVAAGLELVDRWFIVVTSMLTRLCFELISFGVCSSLKWLQNEQDHIEKRGEGWFLMVSWLFYSDSSDVETPRRSHCWQQLKGKIMGFGGCFR